MQVFADHESSHNPIDVPRDWLWNLHRRTVYFGSSIPTIFKGKQLQIEITFPLKRVVSLLKIHYIFLEYNTRVSCH